MENDGKLDKQHQLPHFLAKLWSILDDPQYEEAICWDKSGESFHIVDSYLFKNAVLPRYFKHNNLNSFVRQLNLCKLFFKSFIDLEFLFLMMHASKQLNYVFRWIQKDTGGRKWSSFE